MVHIRFSRMILFAPLAASFLLPASAAARERFGIGIGYYGGYGGYYGGPFYPYGYGYGYGPYGGFAPYGYAPYGGYGYYSGRPLGEVHIKSPDPKAQIYINGAFAGRAHDLKTLYLAPGTYNIEQRIGTDVQKERVYVLANRSLKLEFDKPGIAHSAPSAVPNTAPGTVPDAAPYPAPRPEANPQSSPEARPETNTAPQPAPALPEAQRQ